MPDVRYEVRLEIVSDGELAHADDVEGALIDALEDFPASVYIRGVYARAIKGPLVEEGGARG
jgi:hypothetical protein